MILQSLWFIRPGAPGTPWLFAASIQHDLKANPGGFAQFIVEWRSMGAGVHDVVEAISASILPGLEMRQEWNTPPREIVDGIQPNVP